MSINILIPFVIFILNPLAGIFAMAMHIWNREENQTIGHLYTLALFVSVFLGLQNIGKEMSGDIVEYKEIFLSVPKFESIWDYILKYGKEPVYYGFNYIAYYCFGGKWLIFIFIITVINYMLLSYAVIKTGSTVQTDFRNIVATLFVLLFFFQEFASIGHMIRQCLAQSVVVAFFVSWHIEQRKRWWIAVLALGIHSSSLPVLGIGLLPVLKEKLTVKKAVIVGGLIIALASSFYYVSSMLSSIPFISYIVLRTNQASLFGTDSWQKDPGLNLVTFLLIGIIATMLIYIYIKIKDRNVQDEEVIDREKLIVPYLNITIMIILFVLVCNMIKVYYLTMRYYFFIYAFFFVIVLLYLHYWNPRTKYVYTLLGTLGLFIYYIAYYLSGIFHYYSLMEMLFNPLPLYFL